MSTFDKDELVIRLGTEYGEEEERAVIETLRKGAPTSGDACIQFEQDFAAYCGTSHARAVSNGTAALFLSMLALGVGEGDEVITTPLTWIATAAAAETVGARAVFVDVCPDTYNLDPAKLESAISPRTKAITPVHLYGQCCDMDAILTIAERHGLAVVEDACHAIGAGYKGHKAGSMGALGCFSFHEQKNISTLGEGGMVVTNDPALFERVALYRSHCTRVYGSSTKYCSLDEAALPMGKRFWWQDFDDCGYNFRMTDVQAAVGIEQLKKLDRLNDRRRASADYLTQGLAGVPGLRMVPAQPERHHVYHLFPVEIDANAFGMDKEEFIFRMQKERGIKIGTHYIPLHWSTAFRNRGWQRGDLPVADALAERLITLPINPRQSHEALDYLIESIHAVRGATA